MGGFGGSNLLLLLTIPFIFWVKSTEGVVCSGGCSIRTEGNSTIANCSHQGLDCVPSSLPSDVLVLDLSKNAFHNLKDGIFSDASLLQLEEIYLSGHTVDNIEKYAFRHLEDLQVVDLSHNRLQTIGHYIFADNPNIRKLYLRYNVDLKLPKNGPFLDAPSLEYLDLSFCNITDLSSHHFSKLYGITHLYVHGNGIKVLTKDTFSPLTNLEYLDLSSNQLRADSFDATAFKDHKKLKTLVLRNNKLMTTRSSYYGDYSYRRYTIPKSDSRIYNILKSDSLETLDISSCFDTPPRNPELLCGTPNLKVLNFTQNQMDINYGIFSCLKQLQELYITGIAYSGYSYLFESNSNLLKLVANGPGKWMDMNIQSLRHLDISGLGNVIRSNIFSKMPNLIFMNVSGNHLHIISKKFESLSHLEILDISNIHLCNLPPSIFEKNKKLKELYMNDNLFGNTLTCKFSIPTLQVLDLSRCRLTEISPSSFELTRNLKTLNLAGNRLTELKKGTLRYLENLEYLDLSSCNISHVDPDAFSQNRKLSSLSLQGNTLHAVHQRSSIVNSPSLRTLDLSSCKLPYLVPDYFASLPNLTRLYLQNNELTTLSVSVVRNLNLNELHLYGNPWRCDCVLWKLRGWMLFRRMKETRPVVCAFPNEKYGWSWAAAGDETCDTDEICDQCKKDSLTPESITTEVPYAQQNEVSLKQIKNSKCQIQSPNEINSSVSHNQYPISEISPTESDRITWRRGTAEDSNFEHNADKFFDIDECIRKVSSFHVWLLLSGMAGGLLAVMSVGAFTFFLLKFANNRQPTRKLILSVQEDKV